MPELTVSMPAYNVRAHVAAAVRSVLDQADVDLELIVVDDASTDGTADVVAAMTDPRLRLIRGPRRRGAAACHNLVAAASRATFVAHVAATDLLLPGALHRLVEAARTLPSAAIIHGYSFEVDAHGRVTREQFRSQRRMLLRTRQRTTTQGHLLRHEHAVDECRVYRRTALLALGGLDEHTGALTPFDLALRAAARHTIALVPEFICVHRAAPSGGVAHIAPAAFWHAWRRLLHVRRLRRSQVVAAEGYRAELQVLEGVLAEQGIWPLRPMLAQRWARSRPARHLARAREAAYAALAARLRWWPFPSAPRAVRDAPAPRRHVAYYTWHFPILSQTFVHRELAALRRAGLDLTVVAEAPEDPTIADADARALLPLVTYVDPMQPGLAKRFHRHFFRQHPLRYLSLFAYVLSRKHGPTKRLRLDREIFGRGVYLAGLLLGRGVDHLHSPWADRSALIVKLAARLLDVPHSVHARAHDVHRLTYLDGVRDRLADTAFVVTNTRYNVEHLRALLPPADQARLYHVYNGIDLAQFVPAHEPRAPGPLRLLCVARLIEQKGLVHLLQACRILEQRGYDFVCDVIGGTEEPLYTSYYVQLMLLHRDLGLANRVRFLGAQPFDRVLQAYRCADVFVLPAVIAADGSRDVTPNALIEAMAMQLPVVSTPVTGIPEIVEADVSGLLVPPGDPSALADALGRLFDDPALRRRLGQAARRQVERRFDVDANVARYAALFRGQRAVPTIPVGAG